MTKRHQPVRPDLVELLSLRRGHFRCSSGAHTDLSLDRSRLNEPALLSPLATELAGDLAEVDVVCGAPPDGLLLARYVAAELDATFCPVEQPTATTYRIPSAMRADVRGRTVALVDAVEDTGTAVHGIRAALEGVGARPTAVGALAVLQPPRRRGEPCMWTRSMWNLGLDPAHLAAIDESVWSPEDCPRCAFGVPLEDARPVD